jgi:hypothetical protein
MMQEFKADESDELTLDTPDDVAGWRLCDSSKASDRPAANYHDPAKERVYVNICRPDPVGKPSFWRAKFNPHCSPEGEHIASGKDPERVLEAAIEWMEANPAESTQSLSKWGSD